MAIYLGNDKISDVNVPTWEFQKAYFTAGGKCAYSTAKTFVGVIAYDSTSEVTNMSDMFYHCSSLTTVPQFDTSKVTNMYNMFYNCTSLTTVPQFDTSNVTSMTYMFYNCTSLTTVPQFDTSNVTNMSDMFYNCTSITEIHMTGMKTSFSISACTKMERTALLEVINNLATVTSTKTLTLGSTLKAKLTSDDIAIATGKGWTVA